MICKSIFSINNISCIGININFLNFVSKEKNIDIHCLELNFFTDISLKLHYYYSKKL